MSTASTPHAMLQDTFNRKISYLRLSVTDRCDFRCVYCMAEDMTFMPKSAVLSIEELIRVAQSFVALGATKIRLTGGEPLVRQGLLTLVAGIAALPQSPELTMTTNGARLEQFAMPLKQAGLNRINISLDSLQPSRFASLTRTGKLSDVLAGITAAQDAGFKRIKINAVILRGRNDDEVLDLVRFARQEQLDITFIEEMPLGQIDEHNRALSFVSSDDILKTIRQEFELTTSEESTGGPARYYRMADSNSRIGVISPHSHNFCGDCNRVRVTASGQLLLCLGNEHAVDLRAVLRQDNSSDALMEDAIRSAILIKPERHYFDLNDEPQIVRFMNMTGG